MSSTRQMVCGILHGMQFKMVGLLERRTATWLLQMQHLPCLPLHVPCINIRDYYSHHAPTNQGFCSFLQMEGKQVRKSARICSLIQTVRKTRIGELCGYPRLLSVELLDYALLMRPTSLRVEIATPAPPRASSIVMLLFYLKVTGYLDPESSSPAWEKTLHVTLFELGKRCETTHSTARNKFHLVT